MEKQDAFTQALLRAMDAAEQEAGVRQPRLRRAVEQYGGISAVQELCRRGQVSDGFDRLAGLGKLALSAEALAALAKRHFPQVTACDSVEQALRLARGDAPEGLVVCGSLYLAAQARGLLTK